MDDVGADRGGWIRKASGWSLLAIGIAGCVLPVLPGIPLALAGLLVLSRDYRWAHRCLQRSKRWLIKMRRRTQANRTESAR